MNKAFFIKFFLLSSIMLKCSIFYAGPIPNKNIPRPPTPTQLNAAASTALITPTPPTINAKAYMLIDINSGEIIVENNIDEKLPPASLTKMMTLYVISHSLHNQQLHLTDPVRISQEAWKIGGSRMFVKVDDNVSVEDLLKGIIVDSGNDACVAMAEHLGGSENGFAEIMNHQAKLLNMNSSNFTDSTGLPNPNHYTTARDLSVLGRAIINDFPEYYDWYKQKWFKYNGIRQPNRNRLLWRNSSVDGLKTGHTNEAGYCLVSSAKRQNMRLLAVVLGSTSEAARADDSEKLLNYGFRFYESHALYKKGAEITKLPLYKSQLTKISVGLNQDQFVTIPTGQYQRLKVSTKVPKYLQGPLVKGDKVGELVIQFDNDIIVNQPLYALENAPIGGIYTRMKDSINLMYKRWANS